MILTGFALMLLGLCILFAMVIDAIAPGLFLALAAYASAFGGMMMAVLATAYWLCEREAPRPFGLAQRGEWRAGRRR